MRTILVTGAAGFVGRTLCACLLESGCRVVGVIREHTVIPDGLDGVEWHRCKDIGDDETYGKLLFDADGVVHLAARVHQMTDNSPNPLTEYRRVNVEGTRRLAEASARAGVKKFVYISSIKARNASERDPYGLSKKEAEACVLGLDGNGMETSVLRPCLVYGPGVKANFLNLLKLARSGLPLPLGGLDNRRSYLYVRNLADAIITVLMRSGAAGRTFDVADERTLSTTELIECLCTTAGVKPRLFRAHALLRLAGKLPVTAAFAQRLTESLVSDLAPLRTSLGWLPPYSVEHGIRETVAWYMGIAGDKLMDKK